MPQDPHAQFDHTVLDMIEHSPVGAIPRTPTYQDALTRLYATHQVYASADHKDGHVTARSLSMMPHFQANNLEAVLAGKVEVEALESNESIFGRYVRSLPPAFRARAESFHLMVAGKPAMHRAKVVGDSKKVVAHDLPHTLFLVPGTGPNHGLPGNYLHGSAFQVGSEAGANSWAVHIHDSADGAALFAAPTMQAALEKLMEVLESAPFNMDELGALGFHSN